MALTFIEIKIQEDQTKAAKREYEVAADMYHSAEKRLAFQKDQLTRCKPSEKRLIEEDIRHFSNLSVSYKRKMEGAQFAYEKRLARLEELRRKWEEQEAAKNVTR